LISCLLFLLEKKIEQDLTRIQIQQPLLAGTGKSPFPVSAVTHCAAIFFKTILKFTSAMALPAYAFREVSVITPPPWLQFCGCFINRYLALSGEARSLF
jgi:hypothetical protein